MPVKKATPSAAAPKKATTASTTKKTSTATSTKAKSKPKEDSISAPKAPVEGKIKLKYNNYNNEFEVVDGKLSWPEVDEEYCISFVFQGEFSKRVMAPDGKPVVQKGDSFLGLVDGQQYELIVVEDENAGAGIEGITRDGPISINSDDPMALARMTLSDDLEDKSNCSCVEGNPCAVKYNCKDWNNRFEVAKRAKESNPNNKR